MVRYNKGGSNFDVPLVYFDSKTTGCDVSSVASFSQAVSRTFPHNTALQRALTDYAREQGRFDMHIKGGVTVGRKAEKVKFKVQRGAHKGEVKRVTINKFLSRVSVRKELKAGKKQVYVSTRKVISLKTPRQVAYYRRMSKTPPALIDWRETYAKKVVVFKHG